MSPLLMIDFVQALDADHRREADRQTVANAATADRSGR
jgi:hypothetical protein